MKPYWEGENVTLFHGDCVTVMAGMDENSVDAVVCDPPYELGFMGKAHDSTGVAFDPVTWAAVLRVLKPGAHLIAFGGTRTSHRLAVAIEDAGFEIRDSIAWLYSTGFPKSLNVGKAIDKAAGAEREVTGRTVTPFKVDAAASRGTSLVGSVNGDFSKQITGDGFRYTEVTAPATEAAKQWDGWGTALKPAFEIVVAARKPLSEKTVAANVLAHGTGALNIDATRITTSQDSAGSSRGDSKACTCPSRGVSQIPHMPRMQRAVSPEPEPEGRNDRYASDSQYASERQLPPDSLAGYPSLPCSGDAPALLAAGNDRARFQLPRDALEPVDHQREGLHNQKNQSTPCLQCTAPNVQGRWPANVCLDESQAAALDEQSGTSRSTVGKPRGAASGNGWGMTATGAEYADTGGASRYFPTFRYEAKAPSAERPTAGGNQHSTVKPLELMRWLCRLVTPPRGTVLDCFAGSGTTGEAAIREGFSTILIEQEADYLPLIRERFTRPINYLLEFE